MRFWDSSAIVPLLVEQGASPLVDAWLEEDRELVMWTLTPVEIASALQRLLRDGLLEERSVARAEARAEDLAAASHVVTDIEAVKVQARRLLRLHALRAGDALQLAAAIEWAGGRPSDRTLLTLDERLAQAARREGFLVGRDL